MHSAPGGLTGFLLHRRHMFCVVLPCDPILLVAGVAGMDFGRRVEVPKRCRDVASPPFKKRINT